MRKTESDSGTFQPLRKCFQFAFVCLSDLIFLCIWTRDPIWPYLVLSKQRSTTFTGPWSNFKEILGCQIDYSLEYLEYYHFPGSFQNLEKNTQFILSACMIFSHQCSSLTKQTQSSFSLKVQQVAVQIDRSKYCDRDAFFSSSLLMEKCHGAGWLLQKSMCMQRIL